MLHYELNPLLQPCVRLDLGGTPVWPCGEQQSGAKTIRQSHLHRTGTSCKYCFC